MGVTSSGIPEIIRRRPFLLALGFLTLASAALLIFLHSRLNFLLDDWSFVLYRHEGNVDDFLVPHNEHISILPIAIYKVFLSVFGMGSAMPIQIFSVVAFLASVLVLFVYLRPQVGEPAAVIGCAVILFLGTAWEDLLMAFQMGFFISVGAGIGALIMLRREDRFGDRVACLLLVISMISTSLGIPLAAGVGVTLLLQKVNFSRRLYVVVIPLLIYGLWYLGWGQDASSAASISNAGGIPEYVARSFSLAVTEITGLVRWVGLAENIPSLLPGLAVAVAIGVAVYRRGEIPRPLLVACAIALTFWGLAALNLAPGRGFLASRYQYPNAVFLLMILAGAFEGVRPRARELIALGLVVTLAVAVNLISLRNGYWDVMKPVADKGIASLTAAGIARDTIAPDFALAVYVDDGRGIAAERYLDSERRYGSPAWSDAEIKASSGWARFQIDQTLVLALPVTMSPAPARTREAACTTVEAAAFGSQRTVPLPGPSFTIRSTEDVSLALGRYGDGTPVVAGPSEAGEKSLVHVPADRSDEPWRIGFLGEGDVRVCRVDQPLA